MNTDRLIRKTDQEKLLSEIVEAVTFPSEPEFLAFELGGAYFDLIRDADTLLSAFVLRFVAYSHCRYINPEDFPLGKEFDDHDRVSVHFLAHDITTRHPIGCVRLILDTHSRMQIDDILDISDYRRLYPGRFCEMSRLISWPEHRPAVSRGIRYAAFRLAELNGITQIVGTSREADREGFDRRRFAPMTPYRRRQYEGTHFAPLRGQMLYGNVFDVIKNRDYIDSLVKLRESRLAHSA